MESCIADIRRWMLSKKLKLNDDKTEFLIIGTRQQLEKVNIEELCVGSHFIKPSSVVKNLGSWFDSKLNMLVHINKTCSSFFYLYNLRRIRKYLTRQDTECLVHAFIGSKMACSMVHQLLLPVNFNMYRMLLRDLSPARLDSAT